MAMRWEHIETESAWDWFVLQYSPGALFQSWNWGEVQKRIGVPISRFGLYRGQKLVGVAQTALVKAKRGTFLHVRHGPIVEGNESVWDEMIKHVLAEAKKQGCIFLRMSPLLDAHTKLLPFFKRHHFLPAAMHRMDGEYCWVLDLNQSEEAILSGMRKTTRYEIRRADKEGISIFSTRDPKYLSEFFSLYESTSTRHGFVPHTGIREEFELFAKKNQAVLYLGSFEGKTVAAAIILYYGTQAIYHHGASIQSKIPASYRLQWEAIMDAKKRGMKVYNFWGIAPENSPKHPWRGITLFKKGFGGHELEYVHAMDLPLSPLYMIPRFIESTRKLLRGYD